MNSPGQACDIKGSHVLLSLPEIISNNSDASMQLQGLLHTLQQGMQACGATQALASKQSQAFVGELVEGLQGGGTMEALLASIDSFRESAQVGAHDLEPGSANKGNTPDILPVLEALADGESLDVELSGFMSQVVNYRNSVLSSPMSEAEVLVLKETVLVQLIKALEQGGNLSSVSSHAGIDRQGEGVLSNAGSSETSIHSDPLLQVLAQGESASSTLRSSVEHHLTALVEGQGTAMTMTAKQTQSLLSMAIEPLSHGASMEGALASAFQQLSSLPSDELDLPTGDRASASVIESLASGDKAESSLAQAAERLFDDVTGHQPPQGESSTLLASPLQNKGPVSMFELALLNALALGQSEADALEYAEATVTARQDAIVGTSVIGQVNDDVQIIRSLASGGDSIEDLLGAALLEGSVDSTLLQRSLVEAIANGHSVDKAIVDSIQGVIALQAAQQETTLNSDLAPLVSAMATGQNIQQAAMAHTINPTMAQTLARLSMTGLRESNEAFLEDSMEAHLFDAFSEGAAKGVAQEQMNETLEQLIEALSQITMLDVDAVDLLALSQGFDSQITSSNNTAMLRSISDSSWVLPMFEELVGEYLALGGEHTSGASSSSEAIQTVADALASIQIHELEGTAPPQVFGSSELREPEPGTLAVDANVGTTTFVYHGLDDFYFAEGMDVDVLQYLNQTSYESVSEAVDAQLSPFGDELVMNHRPQTLAAQYDALEDDVRITGQLQVQDFDIGDSHSFQITALPSIGELELAQDGYFEYELASASQGLEQGQVQQVSFEYTVSDGSGWRNSTSDTGSVYISIQGQNDIPEITGQVMVSVIEDSSSILRSSGRLLASGGDAGEELFVPVTWVGDYGTFQMAATGDWTYSADNGQIDIQRLSEGQTLEEVFSAYNVDGETTQAVDITISGLNDAPATLAVLNYTTSSGQGIFTLDSSDLLYGAYDIDNNSELFVSNLQLFTEAVEGPEWISQSPTGPTLSINLDAYSLLDRTESETLQFRFFIEDGNGAHTVQTGNIVIYGENTEPTIAPVQISREYFRVSDNPNLGNDDLPSFAVRGAINSAEDQDLFRLELLNDETLILDIDLAAFQGVWVDTVVTLYDSEGLRVASNDDSSTDVGGQGSIHAFDPYLEFEASEGVYYIGVTSFGASPEFAFEDILGSGEGDYLLNVSIDSTNDASWTGIDLRGESKAELGAEANGEFPDLRLDEESALAGLANHPFTVNPSFLEELTFSALSSLGADGLS